jgi:hypothetical protein
MAPPFLIRDCWTKNRDLCSFPLCESHTENGIPGVFLCDLSERKPGVEWKETREATEARRAVFQITFSVDDVRRHSTYSRSPYKSSLH